jgi:SAM-dependent methyltransferase
MSEPDLTRAGSAFYYDLGGPDYDDVPFYRERAAALGASSLLELGCGTGRVLVPLAGDLPRVTGVDVSAEYIAAARAKLTAAGHRARLVTGRVEGLRLGDRYDLVIAAYHVIQAFTTPAQMDGFFTAVREHLAPGGRCIVTAFHPARDPAAFAKAWVRPQESLVWSRPMPDGTVIDHVDRRPRLDLDPLVLHPELIWRRSSGGTVLEEVRVPISMRCHYPDGLVRLVREHEFTVTAAHGGYAGEPYGQGDELVLELADGASLPG